MLTHAEFDEIKPGQLVTVQTHRRFGSGRLLVTRASDLSSLNVGEIAIEVVARYSDTLIICLLEADKYVNGSKWDKLTHRILSTLNLDPLNLPFNPAQFDWIDLSRDAIIAIQHEKPKQQKSRETPPLPCAECKQFYPYAIANFGDQLICWGCRDSISWKYGKDETGKVYLK